MKKIIFYLIILGFVSISISIYIYGYSYLKIISSTKTNKQKLELTKLIQSEVENESSLISIIKYEDNDLIYEIIKNKPISTNILDAIINKQNIELIKEVFKLYPDNNELMKQVIDDGTEEMIIFIASNKYLNEDTVAFLLEKSIDPINGLNRTLLDTLTKNRYIFPFIIKIGNNADDKYRNLSKLYSANLVVNSVKKYNKNLLDILKGDHLDRIMALYYKEEIDLLDLYFFNKVKMNLDEEKISSIYKESSFYTNINERIMQIKIKERDNQNVKLNYDIIEKLYKQEFKKLNKKDIKEVEKHIKSIEDEVKKALYVKPIGTAFSLPTITYQIGKTVYNIVDRNSKGFEVSSKIITANVKDIIDTNLKKKLSLAKNEDKIKFEIMKNKYDNIDLDFLANK